MIGIVTILVHGPLSVFMFGVLVVSVLCVVCTKNAYFKEVINFMIVTQCLDLDLPDNRL